MISKFPCKSCKKSFEDHRPSKSHIDIYFCPRRNMQQEMVYLYQPLSNLEYLEMKYNEQD